MKGFFATLKKQANSRAKEATLSVLGINNPNLRSHLARKMESDEKFVNGPVFEQMFAWEPNLSHKMEGLVHEGLLSQKVVNALDSEKNGRYAFKKDWNPFKHQYKAWSNLLSPEPKSTIITSGTGSGKTECFMVPVLEDLYRELATNNTPLTGVRAIFLYPLNALINSQRERLNAWTQHFDGDIRFCLFNGNTPEYLESKTRQKQKANPQEVMSRDGLRENPASILVTNGTMLEYMLIRQSDSPIIEKSKGKLRWIVLDEAHTYVGSQAAELALQLRRVMQAFEVEPENIRFVATSATIAGAEAEESLKEYLAKLANISSQQVVVVGGQRVVPPLNLSSPRALTLQDIEAIEPEGELPASKKDKRTQDVSKKRYTALECSEIAKRIRAHLTTPNTTPQSINELIKELSEFKLSEREIYRWIDICTNTKPSKNEEAFLKLRAHYFQRTLDGLWCCSNTKCSHKQSTELQDNWPFGYVYSKHRLKCECGAPVLELAFCNECNEPHLLGAYDTNSNIQQWINRQDDEFSLTEGEREDLESLTSEINDSEVTSRTSGLVIFSANESEQFGYCPVSFRIDGKMVNGADGELELFIREDDSQECSDCGHSGRGQHGKALRRCLLGAPFFTTNTVPTILEYCTDFEPEEDNDIGPNSLPARGRRLITFTDSRQGTAKISVSMQQEAERSHFRGALVRELRRSLESKMNIEPHILEKVKEFQSMSVDLLKTLLPQIKKLKPQDAEALDQYIKILEKGSNSKKVPKPLSWTDLITVLKGDQDISQSMTRDNMYLAPEVFDKADASKLSEMILTREVARRPKYRNNVETQGLIKLVYPGIESVEQVPKYWTEHDLTLKDWKDYLKICMDFYVRENTFVAVNPEWASWIGMHFYPKFLISPDSKDEDENRVKNWPLVKSGKKVQQRIVSLLAKAAKFSSIEKKEEDIINLWLRAAWNVLISTRTLSEFSGKQFQLKLNTVEFSLMTEAYVCPITNKLLDTVFAGITPYIPWNKDAKDFECNRVTLPSIWEFDTSSDVSSYIDEVRQNVSNDETVKALRQQNLWTDINDRAVEGGFYYTTAEHSAQQSTENLERYEDMFKKGKKNVLNCSTTMEMGVDIGGISAVVMNNVPPHPANYLQRAGRAGRSSESRAIGFTICKNNPHDQFVFNQPKWPFITAIPAPNVTFSSAKLVQRHINAFLLGKFLREKVGITKTEKLFLSLEWFYIASDSSSAIYELFIDWVMANAHDMRDLLAVLVRDTTLSSSSELTLCEAAKSKIEELAKRWLGEYNYIQAELSTTDAEGPYAHKLNNDLYRLSREYLLRDLATRGFLPGYGFPTDVVNLSVYSLTDYIRSQESKRKKETKDVREDNVSVSRGMPSRNLAVAIREFAPGTELVLDGRVHKSAGISLNWQNVHVDGAKESQKFDIAWKCDSCGQTGYEPDLNKQSNLYCSNLKCNKPIKAIYQRRVIQPTGFVVDFYHPPSNNIANTHYVPVEQPWVIGKGEHISLPNPELGYMVTDSSGNVFHHSSGLYGKGYALCLGCGKAESMTPSDELPKTLSLDEPHRPPMPNKFQKNSNNKPECSASGKILEGIHLGYNTTTDVFELVLRNPDTKEYITDKTIATSIAVALRKALVVKLGISVNEVGYGTRPALVEAGNHAEVIQLFDMVSGGAGFAISASNYIESLLKSIQSTLDCDDHCEKFCHTCLLETDSRHDIDRLDRTLALEWVELNVKDYVSLPIEFQSLLGEGCRVHYIASSLKEKLNELSRTKPDAIKFFFSDDFNEWDISSSQYKKLFYGLLRDEIDVQVFVQNCELDNEIKAFLSLLNNIGVKIYAGELPDNLVFQAAKGEHITSIATASSKARLPGSNWLLSDAISVESHDYPEINGQEINFERVSPTGTGELTVLKELNGKVNEFGKRLVEFIKSSDSRFNDSFKSANLKEIKYTDRYLQSPTSLIMLSEVLSTLSSNSTNNISIKTCFDKKDLNKDRYTIQHDWEYQQDYEKIFVGWLSHACGQPVKVDLLPKQDVPHRRTLVLIYDNGRVATITFDQGFGYWKLDVPRGLHKFSFESSVREQIIRLGEAYGSAQVRNRADWDTWLTVSISDI